MNKKGFTLIELLISMAIIGIIAATLLPILSISLGNIVFSGKRTEAVSMAHDNIYYESVLTSFSVDVRLPALDEDGEHDMITVEGNKATGSAVIPGDDSKSVDLFIYRPNSN